MNSKEGNVSGNSSQFIRKLFDFLRSQGHTNVKIPQIGGKELDLYYLYTSVTSRGGFYKVTENKLWKDIVNEFVLPASCTSASFTLKTHYQKYLLAFERKELFGEENTNVSEFDLFKRKKVKTLDSPEDFSVNTVVGPKNVVSPPGKENDLKSNLIQSYIKKDKNLEVLYVKKHRTVPVLSEIKRMMLSFESQLQEEIRYTLNSLLLFSTNKSSPFYIDNYNNLIENMTKYFSIIIKKVPNLLLDEPSLNIESLKTNLEDILKNEYNLQVLRLNALEKVTIAYENSAPLELLEQTRIIMLIYRNLSMIKHNDSALIKDTLFLNCVIQIFVYSMDYECVKYAVEICSNLSRHLLLKEVPKHDKFMIRLLDFINIDSTEESSAALECLRNLTLCAENETIVESFVPLFLETLSKLLVSTNSELREISLEILCLISDLKMNTRLQLAKDLYLLPRLIAIMASGLSNQDSKELKLAGIIIINISMAPAARPYFLPYERDLFAIGSSDENCSKLICNVLSDIDQCAADPITLSSNIYGEYYLKEKKLKI